MEHVIRTLGMGGICDNWVDLDGDGLNDNCLMDGTGNQYRYGASQGKSYGSGDGTGHYGLCH